MRRARVRSRATTKRKVSLGSLADNQVLSSSSSDEEGVDQVQVEAVEKSQHGDAKARELAVKSDGSGGEASEREEFIFWQDDGGEENNQDEVDDEQVVSHDKENLLDESYMNKCTDYSEKESHPVWQANQVQNKKREKAGNKEKGDKHVWLQLVSQMNAIRHQLATGRRQGMSKTEKARLKSEISKMQREIARLQQAEVDTDDDDDDAADENDQAHDDCVVGLLEPFKGIYLN